MLLYGEYIERNDISLTWKEFSSDFKSQLQMNGRIRAVMIDKKFSLSKNKFINFFFRLFKKCVDRSFQTEIRNYIENFYLFDALLDLLVNKEFYFFTSNDGRTLSLLCNSREKYTRCISLFDCFFSHVVTPKKYYEQICDLFIENISSCKFSSHTLDFDGK